MQEFPVLDEADQQFGVIMNNRRVTIRLRYNPLTDRWSMDLSIDDLPVLHAVRMTLGVDLLAQFDFDIGRLYLLELVKDAKPDRSALPSGAVRLYHVTEDEIADFLQTGA